jgi:hypothetical protein
MGLLGRLAQGLARFLDTEEVSGSIPLSPTKGETPSKMGFLGVVASKIGIFDAPKRVCFCHTGRIFPGNAPT